MSEPIQVTSARRIHALFEVGAEMERQIDKWGVQEHPSWKYADVFMLRNALGVTQTMPLTEHAKQVCDVRMNPLVGIDVSWQDILNEEFLEARDEAIKGDLISLREELIQVAAVALSWVGSIDRETNRCLECELTGGAHEDNCSLNHKE